MNVAIKSFGQEVVIEHLYQFYTHYNLPIVSVGSGLGTIEYLAKQKHPEIEFICIDPEPTAFLKEKQICIQPDYAYVKDLLAEKDISGSCILFLNWCQPDLDYDYEAIQLLNPLGILTLYSFEYNDDYEKQPSMAGGKLFVEWLNSQYSYTELHHSNLRYKFDIDERHLCNFEILWLNDKMFPETKPRLEDVYMSQRPAIENGCVIC